MAEDDEPSIGEDLARELSKAIRERDEAREQVRALTEQLAEAKLAGDLEHEGRMAAQEQVRSLTVERDAALDEAARARLLGEAESRDLCKAETSRDELAARLSRAREALAAIDAAAKEGERAQARLPWYGPASSEEYDAAVEAGDRALAALRAALSEPPAG